MEVTANYGHLWGCHPPGGGVVSHNSRGSSNVGQLPGGSEDHPPQWWLVGCTSPLPVRFKEPLSWSTEACSHGSADTALWILQGRRGVGKEAGTAYDTALQVMSGSQGEAQLQDSSTLPPLHTPEWNQVAGKATFLNVTFLLGSIPSVSSLHSQSLLTPPPKFPDISSAGPSNPRLISNASITLASKLSLE